MKWELEKTSLVENPLHKNQHAYSRVKNCNTALTRVVDQIEKGLLRKEFTLGLFIDISGAFNNLITEKALQAMVTGASLNTWSLGMNHLLQTELLTLNFWALKSKEN